MASVIQTGAPPYTNLKGHRSPCAQRGPTLPARQLGGAPRNKTIQLALGLWTALPLRPRRGLAEQVLCRQPLCLVLLWGRRDKGVADGRVPDSQHFVQQLLIELLPELSGAAMPPIAVLAVPWKL